MVEANVRTSGVAIGYYAHHQGAGHVTRALTIAAHLSNRMTLFGSTLPDKTPLANVELHHLPLDYDAHTLADTPAGLHYAPLAVEGLRERMGSMVDWFRSNWPCLLIVDVSVEVALLARLCGVPTIYMRQRGNRTDPAHSLAYACASRLLAPYPAQLEEPETSAEWIHKTDYVGLISKYAACPSEIQNASPVKPRHVTVITGFGGTELNVLQLADAARKCPDWQWTVLGPVANDAALALPSNFQLLGLVRDPREWLTSAHVVVGSAGDSLVSEIADLRCRFICLPETRPFDEQRSTSERLAAAGLAIHCAVWPEAEGWPALLDQATKLTPAMWEPFASGNGAARAAAAISRVTEEVLQ